MKTLLTVVMCTWFGSCLAGMVYLADKRLVNFDPKMVLLDRSMSMDFDQELTQILKATYGDVANTAFHLTDDNCFCATISKPHIQRVSRALSDSQFKNHTLESGGVAFASMQALLPSSPAVVIFGDDEQLLYAGPYSKGMMCSSNTGFVEPLLASMKTQTQIGAVIVSDVEGCFCNHEV